MPTLTDPAATIGYLEILSRLTLAVVIGCILGLNRELHGKPAGVRTHGLVALGAALLTVTGVQLSWLSSSKTMDFPRRRVALSSRGSSPASASWAPASFCATI